MRLLLLAGVALMAACGSSTEPSASCPNDIYSPSVSDPYFGCYALVDSMGAGMTSFVPATGVTLVLRAQNGWTWDSHGAGHFDHGTGFVNLVDTVNTPQVVWSAQFTSADNSQLVVSYNYFKYLFNRVR